MIKRLSMVLLLSFLSLAACNTSKQPNSPTDDNVPSETSSDDKSLEGSKSDSSKADNSVTPPPSGPTKVVVNSHTLNDGNPPININSIGQNVNKTIWNSFKGASASKFNNNYNYTYRYLAGGQVTYETFTKDGYELSNSTGTYYYERINGNLYYYSSGSDGYERISSSYNFINRRSEVLAHEVSVHMFEYENYEYFSESDGGSGEFIYSTSAFSTVVKFQGGYLTYLRYTLNSPITTYEVYLSFESTITIPKSYYYQS